MRRPASRPRPSIAAAAPVLGATSPAAAGGASPFRPVATFAVDGEVAEIFAATPDGITLLYTDSAARRVGFVDISDPATPSSPARRRWRLADVRRA